MTSKDLLDRRKALANDMASIGLFFPAAIAVGLAIGYFLDKWLHTSPYLLIIFTLYGIVSGFVNLLKVTRKPAPKNNTSDDQTTS